MLQFSSVVILSSVKAHSADLADDPSVCEFCSGLRNYPFMIVCPCSLTDNVCLTGLEIAYTSHSERIELRCNVGLSSLWLLLYILHPALRLVGISVAVSISVGV